VLIVSPEFLIKPVSTVCVVEIKQEGTCEERKINTISKVDQVVLFIYLQMTGVCGNCKSTVYNDNCSHCRLCCRLCGDGAKKDIGDLVADKNMYVDLFKKNGKIQCYQKK